MTARKPRRKWMSKSAHPKEGLRHYPGPGEHLRLRNGVPTHYNLRADTCVRCGADVPERGGWLLILPFRQGVGGSSYAVMCYECAGPPDATEAPP